MSSTSRSSTARVRRFLQQDLRRRLAAVPVASTSQAATPVASSSKSQNPIQLRKLSSPFQPFLNPESGRWWPARYSARREASLAQAALAQDPDGQVLSQLPQGKKIDKLRARLEYKVALSQGVDEEVLRLLSSQKMGKMNPEHQEAAFRRLREAQGAAWPLARLSKEQERTELLRVARSTVAKQGPYAGRKPSKMFKGTKAELSRPRKDKAIEEKLESMENVVKEWKQNKINERTKARPTVPF